ncbi:PKD domain-containing protein, partial [Salegentibacter sp. LM13S]|uniref:PKD domain-containing protein n=1 Tax=Salegentibacter lacus TaxID=2873599 RepID=UPI001CCC5885
MIWKTTFAFFITLLKLSSQIDRVRRSNNSKIFLLLVLGSLLSGNLGYSQIAETNNPTDTSKEKCNSQDFANLTFYIGDQNGAPIANCSAGDNVSAYIWVNSGNNPNRYSLWTQYTLTITDSDGNATSKTFEGCKYRGEAIPNNGSFQISEQINWECGSTVEISQFYLSWQENLNSNECGPTSPKCVNLGDITRVETPVVADFDFSQNCDSYVVNFENKTSGGNDENGAFQYTWNFGGSNTSNEENPSFNFTEAGNYEVTLTSAQGAETNTITQTVSVLDPIEVSYVNEDLDCSENSTGSIDISVTGGTGNYTYSWTGPDFNSTDEDLTGLDEGTYQVTVTDGNNCSVTQEITLSRPEAPDAPVVAGEVSQPTCDIATGSFSITAVTGMEYSFNGGAFETTTSWSELAADTYTVTARNADGCESEALSVTINAQPETPDAPVVAGEVSQPTCDIATGSFSITAVTGMEYSFNGGAFETTTSWSELAADTYTVTARNADGCESEALSVTINAQP